MLAACGFPPSDAALVDGIPITDVTLQERIPAVKLLQGLQGGVCGASAQGEPPAPEDEEAACARQTLTLLIQGQVMRNQARELGVEVTDADIEEFRAAIVQASGGQAAFDATLAEAKVTQAQIDGLLGELGLYSVLQKKYAEDTVDDAALRRLYDENKTQFVMIDTAHVLVDSPEKAQAILDTVTPANFAQVAGAKSDDPGSAANGGEMGPMSVASFVPEFADAVLKAKPGTIIGPVKSQFGWHVIWVHSVETTPFEEARGQLLQNEPEALAAFQAMLMEAYRAAEIEVNPRYGRWDATSEQPEVVPITSTDPDASPPPTVVPTPEPVGLPEPPPVDPASAP